MPLHYFCKLHPKFPTSPTVVMDAGIATAANLVAVQEAGFHYIAVSRSRPQEIPKEGLVVTKESDATTIQVKRLDQDGEVLLYCRSSVRGVEGSSHAQSYAARFEEERLASTSKTIF